jgi:hypothetical protein
MFEHRQYTRHRLYDENFSTGGSFLIAMGMSILPFFCPCRNDGAILTSSNSCWQCCDKGIVSQISILPFPLVCGIRISIAIMLGNGSLSF